ncbi:MAG: dockerin type I repeat-containing protein [Verrucomicrobiota bacterium]|nr:dockerin type I repeat-containing protein [Verrucomicrobiota bacterium]
MHKLKLLLSVTFIAVSLGLLVFAFAPYAGAGRREINPAGVDPDLPSGATKIDKEAYLNLRSEWTMLRRGYDPNRPFDPDARTRAIEQMGRQIAAIEFQRMALGAAAPALSATAWTPLGPAPVPAGQTSNRADPVTGRVISIAIHPTNPDIVFVGTASGGLYRTLNGQTANPTWTPLMDTVQMQSNGFNALGTLAIGAIAIAPSDPNIVYVGTGEQKNGFIGSGLYRIDNATTGTPTLVGPINPSADYGNGVTPTFTYRTISQIVVHPTMPGTIFVSTADGQAGLTTHNGTTPPAGVPPKGIMGIYRSTNATDAASGVAFTKLKVNGLDGFATGNTDISDMVTDPSDATGNTIIAWARNGGGPDSKPTACTENCTGVYRSIDALAATPTFTQQLASLNGDVRGELSINKVGSLVTVIAATGEKPASVPVKPNPNNCKDDQFGLIRRSVDGGVTWPNTDSTAANTAGLLRAGDGFCGGQCFYDIGVAIDPTNSNFIQIGGNANYGGCQVLTKRSTDGVTFAENTTGLHGDVQVFAVSSSNPAIVWTGNDGGTWRSTDSGGTWTSMNGDPAASTNPAGKLSASQYISMATHPRDREFLIGGTQDNGTHLKRAQTDTAEWQQVAGGDGGYAAIDQNATDAENVTMYHTFFNLINGADTQITYERVLTATAAKNKNWTSFNCVAGGANNTRIDCNASAVSFYAPMVLGPGNPNTLYFGTDRLYRSADRGDTMQLVSQAPIVPNVEITSISVAPGNDNVRLLGMRNGTVWATTDGSTMLTNVTPVGAPAGVTVGKVMIDPNITNAGTITAYIAYGGLGTSAAPVTHVWKTTNLAGGAGTWVAMSNGLPDVPVDAIAIDRLSATAPNPASTIYLGTDIGVYRSTDGGGTWAVYNPGNTLPVLPVFDMAFQQDAISGSRILRLATFGRGIWEIQTALPPTPSLVVSRKLHNGVAFDIPLPLSGNPGIECRLGGAINDYQVVFTFPSAVTFNSAAVTSGAGSVTSSTGSGTTTVTVDLSGVTTQQRTTITLSNVSNGTSVADVSVPMAVLVGDANGDASVNSADATTTRNASGQTVNATNFRADCNADGSINSADATVVRARSGNFLP